MKVVRHQAVLSHLLGAHSGGAPHQVALPNVRHKSLKGGDKGLLAERAVHLQHAHPPIPGGHGPEAAIPQGSQGLRHVDPRHLVPLSGKGQHRVGPGLHVSVDGPGEVYAKEGELRVGHRVDESPHHVACLRRKHVVFTPEGHDSDVLLHPHHPGDSVRVEAGAVDDALRPDVPLCGRDVDQAVGMAYGHDPCSGHNLPPVVAEPVGVGQGNLGVVDDPRVGRVEGPHTTGVRLQLPELLGLYHPQPGDAIGGPAPVQLIQAGKLAPISGDNYLAAHLILDAVVSAKLQEGAASGHAVPGLEGTRPVVDSRVNHPAVVPGLVGCQLRFLLQDHGFVPGVPGGQLQSSCKANDAAAYDGYIVAEAAHSEASQARRPFS